MRFREEQTWPRGRVERLQHHSSVLKDNPWRDPANRELCVYLPHGYTESGSPLISLWDLAGFTNSGPGHLNWRNHGENLPQRLDRLIGEGRMPPVAVVMPDCYTSLGGNQYVNSPSVGRYSDYVIEELIPFVSDRLNLRADSRGRAAFGKSSGGFGALYLAMEYPGCWAAVASHAGDAGFEWLFFPEFPQACSVLSQFDGDISAFLERFWSKNQPSGRDFAALMVIAMAASYDPRPDEPLGIELPFDLDTMELDEAAWKRWMAFDPVVMIERRECQEALRALSGLYIDVGRRDQYNIHYGNRRLRKRLADLEIACHYEEFDGTHSAIDWRLDTSLPWLTSRLVVSDSA